MRLIGTLFLFNFIGALTPRQRSLWKETVAAAAFTALPFLSLSKPELVQV